MILQNQNLKRYNLTYFITFIAVATCRDTFFEPSQRKPYKMFYIGMFYNVIYESTH